MSLRRTPHSLSATIKFALATTLGFASSAISASAEYATIDKGPVAAISEEFEVMISEGLGSRSVLDDEGRVGDAGPLSVRSVKCEILNALRVEGVSQARMGKKPLSEFLSYSAAINEQRNEWAFGDGKVASFLNPAGAIYAELWPSTASNVSELEGVTKKKTVSVSLGAYADDLSPLEVGSVFWDISQIIANSTALLDPLYDAMYSTEDQTIGAIGTKGEVDRDLRNSCSYFQRRLDEFVPEYLDQSLNPYDFYRNSFESFTSRRNDLHGLAIAF